MKIKIKIIKDGKFGYLCLIKESIFSPWRAIYGDGKASGYVCSFFQDSVVKQAKNYINSYIFGTFDDAKNTVNKDIEEINKNLELKKNKFETIEESFYSLNPKSNKIEEIQK